MDNTTNSLDSSAQILALSDEIYVRQRTRPSRGDLDYLHLSDLYACLAHVAHGITGPLLDYGCGGSPYEQLFAACRPYIHADIAPGPKVDKVLSEDFSTGQPDATYGTVLSTQVLEHVREPRAYLAEAYRVLKPGGTLILTSHGVSEEHGCPSDYQRWTTTGLEHLITCCGFEEQQSYKLTTEIRAFIQLFHYGLEHLRSEDRRILHFFMRAWAKIHRVLFRRPLNYFGDLFPSQKVAPCPDKSSLYIAICIVARKPQAS